MIKLDKAVIVEGKYDKIKLGAFLDALIITTDGFGIFKDREKTELIRTLARTKGIVILTDSDSAGFVIRNHIKGCIKDGDITNVYIPQIKGKEKRKEKQSAEGLLGVEGISAEILMDAFEKAGVTARRENGREPFLTKTVMMDCGLIGGENSAVKRRAVLKRMGLPTRLSTGAMTEVINSVFTREEFYAALKDVSDADDAGQVRQE